MTRTLRHRLHPELAARLKPLAGRGPEEVSVDILQSLGAPYGPAERWDLRIEEHEVPRDGGVVRVRVYRPAGPGAARAALVWLHGGAWVGGDIDMPEAHETARGLAGRADAVVVSVDYRLCGPTVHFPVPHDDVVAAYRWVREHAHELEVDSARVALGGASAGGNLAVGAALRLRDEGQVPWQVLLAYPLVHASLPEPSPELAAALEQVPPIVRPEKSPFLDQVYAAFLDAPIETAPAYAFVGLAEELRGFPPTYIDNDEFDGLRASGELFAEQLRAAGVEVELVTSPGVVHGHLNLVGLNAAHTTLDRMSARLRRDRSAPKMGVRT